MDPIPNSLRHSAAETPPEKLEVKQNTALLEFAPTAIFMIAYNLANAHKTHLAHLAHGATLAHGASSGFLSEPIYFATSLFMAATTAAFLYAWLVEKRLPIMLAVTTVVVLVFGGLGILLHNEVFIKMKPTIINLLFAGAILGGLAFRQNVWKMLFGSAFVFPDAIWRLFAVRWGLFYLGLAVLNELIWRNFSDTFWVNFKLFGVIPLTLIFVFAHTPVMLKWLGKTDADYAARDEPRAAPH